MQRPNPSLMQQLPEQQLMQQVLHLQGIALPSLISFLGDPISLCLAAALLQRSRDSTLPRRQALSISAEGSFTAVAVTAMSTQ